MKQVNERRNQSNEAREEKFQSLTDVSAYSKGSNFFHHISNIQSTDSSTDMTEYFSINEFSSSTLSTNDQNFSAADGVHASTIDNMLLSSEIISGPPPENQQENNILRDSSSMSDSGVIPSYSSSSDQFRDTTTSISKTATTVTIPSTGPPLYDNTLSNSTHQNDSRAKSNPAPTTSKNPFDYTLHTETPITTTNHQNSQPKKNYQEYLKKTTGNHYDLNQEPIRKSSSLLQEQTKSNYNSHQQGHNYSLGVPRTQSDASTIISNWDPEWTEQDSSYGTACPICGCIPKPVRKAIEFTLIGTFIVMTVLFIISTSFRFGNGKQISDDSKTYSDNTDDPYYDDLKNDMYYNYGGGGGGGVDDDANDDMVQMDDYYFDDVADDYN